MVLKLSWKCKINIWISNCRETFRPTRQLSYRWRSSFSCVHILEIINMRSGLFYFKNVNYWHLNFCIYCSDIGKLKPRRRVSVIAVNDGMFVRAHRTVSFPSLPFFIHFPKPELSRAMVSSFNQFSKCKNTPSRTVGNEHCNNNNTKSNLNYALKRLGQNNPQNKHKHGGGDTTCDQMQGGELHRTCVDVFLPDGGICGKLCLNLGVRMMRMCLFWEMRVCWGITVYYL